MKITINQNCTVNIENATVTDLQRLSEFQFSYHFEELLKAIKSGETDALADSNAPLREQGEQRSSQS